MTTRIRRVVATFGWWQWLLAGVLVLALVLAGLFAARTVRYWLYWSQHRNEPIERWMTVNYVARSYSVPPEVLRAALGMEQPGGLGRDRRPLGQIAEERGESFEEVRTALERAIARARPPTPAAPPLLPGSDRGAGGGP